MSEIFLEKIQVELETITRKWWFYLLLMLPIFTGTYASKGYDVHQSLDVIIEVLSSANIYKLSALFPIANAIPIILIINISIFENKMRSIFNIYTALLFLGISIFQNSAQTETYGTVVSIGNLILVMVLVLSWLWEIVVTRNDFFQRKFQLWRWWVIPIALFDILAPVNSNTLAPSLNLVHMLTNEAGLTNCMILPVILAVLSIYYPTSNLIVFHLMSFVGILFGVLNTILWFFVFTAGWWMCILHLPLLIISTYAFILGQLNLVKCSFLYRKS